MNKKHTLPTLTLDFDGVVHSYASGWKGAAVIPDSPVPGALRFIIEAQKHFQVAIFSSRSHQWGGRRAMRKWLYRHACELFEQVRFDKADADNPETQFFLKWGAQTYEPWEELVKYAADELVKAVDFPKVKPPAMVGLDDRVLTFTGVWPDVQALTRFEPWTKNPDQANAAISRERVLRQTATRYREIAEKEKKRYDALNRIARAFAQERLFFDEERLHFYTPKEVLEEHQEYAQLQMMLPHEIDDFLSHCDTSRCAEAEIEKHRLHQMLLKEKDICLASMKKSRPNGTGLKTCRLTRLMVNGIF